MDMKYKLKVLILVIFSFGCLLIVMADEPKIESKPISITDPQLKQSIKTAYDMIVLGNKDMQIAILQAKVKYKVPEDWDIDLNTLTFRPQTKEELPKTTPQPVKP